MTKTKQIFSLLIICLYATFKSQAQISVEVQSGANLSTVYQGSRSFDSEVSPKLGYFGAFKGKYQFNERIGASLSAMLSLEGYNSVLTINSISRSLDNRYVNLRFLPEFEYQFSERLSVFTGFAFGIPTRNEFRSGDGDWVEAGDLLDKEIDVNLSLGGTYSFGKVILNIRYMHGIRDVDEITFTDDNGEIDSVSGQRNRVVQLGIGYRFFDKG